MQLLIQKTLLVVAPGLGVGPLPDAYFFNDRDCNTLGHLAEEAIRFDLPFFNKAGLGNITFLPGLERSEDTNAFYGRLGGVADAKDPFIGSWEMAGFKYLNPSQSMAQDLFNEKSIAELQEILQLKTVGNASYTDREVLTKIMPFHLANQELVCYTNEQNNLYLASTPDLFTTEQMLEMAQKLLPFCRKRVIQQIIVRSVKNDKERFSFTSYDAVIVRDLQQSTIFDVAKAKGIPVTAVGSFCRYFREKAYDEHYFGSSDADRMSKLSELVSESKINKNGQAIIACGLTEFDEKYALNKNIPGAIAYLSELDNQLQLLIRKMDVEDILIFTSNSGCDLKHSSNVHTREYVPFLVYSKMLRPYNKGFLGVRKTLADIAETISEMYEFNTHFGAESFWKEIVAQI